jgi:chromosome segregation ATPase
MILREIVTKLSFLIDQKKLFKFNDTIAQIKDNLNELGKYSNLAKKSLLGLTGTATAISLLSLHTAKVAKTADQLAEKLGITAEELQSIELAAQSTGLGVGELSESMNVFHKKLGDIGQGNNEATREMARLGIVFTGVNGKVKSSFQLYEELAQKIDSINSPIARASALQKVLGTDNIELARLFKNGGESLRQQRIEIEKIGYIIDSRGIKSSKDYIKSWSELQIIVSSVKKELSIKFMPVFNNMIKAFKGWFIENRKIISQNISSFINVLSIALNILFRALQLIITPINKVIEVMGGFENAVSVVGIALAFILTPRILAAVSAFRALTVAMLTNPLTWIIAGLAALGVAIGLVINDLYHWVQGNESAVGIIGVHWYKFKVKFFGVIDDITDYFVSKFKDLASWFTGFWNDTLNFDNIVNKISKATGIKKAEDIEIKLARDAARPRFTGLTGATSAISLSPNSPTSGVISGNNYNSDKKVNQYITENITVTVPSGTSSEQSASIATQIAQEMQLQFNVNMQRGIDSISGR